jgi:Fe-S cluster assembly ATPase SufC
MLELKQVRREKKGRIILNGVNLIISSGGVPGILA